MCNNYSSISNFLNTYSTILNLIVQWSSGRRTAPFILLQNRSYFVRNLERLVLFPLILVKYPVHVMLISRLTVRGISHTRPPRRFDWINFECTISSTCVFHSDNYGTCSPMITVDCCARLSVVSVCFITFRAGPACTVFNFSQLTQPRFSSHFFRFRI